MSRQHSIPRMIVKPATFDFDEWAALAVADPVAFDERRRRMIEDFILSSPLRYRRRLRGLQFRIDMERRRSKTPMAACIRISRMMWDSVLGPDGLQEQFGRIRRAAVQGAVNPRPDRNDSSKAMARVLRFPSDRRPQDC